MKNPLKPLSCCLVLMAMLLLSCAPTTPEEAAAAQGRAASGPVKPAQTAKHPVDGVWQADLAATNKIFSLPANAPADLEHLTMTLDAQTGKMLLAWADGASASRTFRFLSYAGRVYRCSVSGVTDHSYLLDASQPDRLILKDGQYSLVFRRKDRP